MSDRPEKPQQKLPPEMDFVVPLPNFLERVQEGFDTYQRACFTERPPEFFCLELNGEAGELANIEKKSWKGKEIAVERFEDEAADVFIALMNYCNARGIRLGPAVAKKLHTIEERRQAGTH